MSAELAPIIHVQRGNALIRTVSGTITMPYSEPCSWSVVLDNSSGNYNPSSPVAQVRANATTYSRIHVDDDVGEWSSPELVTEDYDYQTDVVTISGRCRLSELDREDQVIVVPDTDGLSTAEGWSCADLCDLIVTQYGLTIEGAPDRIVGEFNLVGSPLQMLRDLLEPTHVFRMDSSPGTIRVTPSTSHPIEGTLKDDEDLEILQLRRTTEIYNRATVERLVPQQQYEILFDDARSGPSELGAIGAPPNGPHQLRSPSRQFVITINDAYRSAPGNGGGLVGIRLIGEDGETVGPAPFLQPSYSGPTPVYAFSFNYIADEEAATKGPWTPNWRFQIQGVPIDVDPVPEVGYSETYSVGGGDRPYPEPHSSILVSTPADARAAAIALVERGTREGQILNCATRLRVSKIISANASVVVVDAQAELNLVAVVEACTLAWDEQSDTGTLRYDCTFSEVS